MQVYEGGSVLERKRTLHAIQKTTTHRKSKNFLISRKEAINQGKLNILEYVVICAIMLISEAVDGNKVTITDIKKLYDEIVLLKCRTYRCHSLEDHKICWQVGLKRLVM
jgi:hypothetical protein